MTAHRATSPPPPRKLRRLVPVVVLAVVASLFATVSPAAAETRPYDADCEHLPADAVTVSEVTQWRDDLDQSRAWRGVRRFNRVLESFGVATGTNLTAMTATQAEGVARWVRNDRWDRISRTMTALDQCAATPEPDPEPEPELGAGSESESADQQQPTQTQQPQGQPAQAQQPDGETYTLRLRRSTPQTAFNYDITAAVNAIVDLWQWNLDYVARGESSSDPNYIVVGAAHSFCILRGALDVLGQWHGGDGTVVHKNPHTSACFLFGESGHGSGPEAFGTALLAKSEAIIGAHMKAAKDPYPEKWQTIRATFRRAASLNTPCEQKMCSYA